MRIIIPTAAIARLRRSTAVFMVMLFVSLPALSAGCGGTASTQSAASGSHRTIIPTRPAEMATFDRHAGLAFGIFHRYVYGPFTAGMLEKKHKLALAKAGAAAAAAAREVVVAKQKAGQSTALRKLFGPLAALEPTLGGLATSLNRGHTDAAGVRAANGAIANIERTGSVGGVKIAERAPMTNPRPSR